MTMPVCPSCGTKVIIAVKPRMGQLVKCQSCHEEMEVVWLDPVELDWPYVVDDDDEDEYGEEDFEEESY